MDAYDLSTLVQDRTTAASSGGANFHLYPVITSLDTLNSTVGNFTYAFGVTDSTNKIPFSDAGTIRKCKWTALIRNL